jgi:hypothetical protein
MSALFEGEQIRSGSGYPSLIRFFEGDADKPLVVFFPGWSHLGRISYGFPGCDKSQFLAHWVTKKGYSFLATSYPIDHPVYDRAYPEFTLTDWAEMVAQIVKEIISEHGLKKEIICINWSAAGQVIRPFNVAISRTGINLKFTLGAEASPGLQFPSDRTKGLRKTKKNLVSAKSFLYDFFWEEIEHQNSLNGLEIMDKKQYYKYFLGDMPIAITGANEFYRDGKFEINPLKAEKDKGFFSFAEYPMVAVISGKSKLVPYHPIVDRYTWGFLMVRKIYHGTVVGSQSEGAVFTEPQLRDLLQFIDNLPNRLSKRIPGNHFVFLGKKGARGISNSLVKFDSEMDKIKSELSGILNRLS